MIPMVSIIGKSDSGKTRLLTRLTTELNERGYRIATIKHAQEIHFKPGKDSQHHLEAGSEVTAVATPEQLVIIKPTLSEMSPEEIPQIMGDGYDIILVEGFKNSKLPKIQVHRKQNGIPLNNIKQLLAIVTGKPNRNKIKQFKHDDIKGIADLVEEDFLKTKHSRFALHVNDKQIPLKAFPEKIIKDLVMSFVSSLKGIKEIDSIGIHYKQ
jgi:molybdopterin-guanine dinucleotide biosynthesis protein B